MHSSGLLIQARLSTESSSHLLSLVSALLAQLNAGELDDVEHCAMCTVLLTSINDAIRNQPAQSNQDLLLSLWSSLFPHAESLLSDISRDGFSSDLCNIVQSLGQLLDLLLFNLKEAGPQFVDSSLFGVAVSGWIQMWVDGSDGPASVFGGMIHRIATEHGSALRRLADLLSETPTHIIAASLAQLCMTMNNPSISLTKLQSGYDFAATTIACGDRFHQLFLDKHCIRWCAARFLRLYDIFNRRLTGDEYPQLLAYLALSLQFVCLSFRHGLAAIFQALDTGFLITLFKFLFIFKAPYSCGEDLEMEFSAILATIRNNLQSRRISNRVLEDWRFLADRDNGDSWPIDSLVVTKAWVELLGKVACM
ncbi:uncharacterized protein ARMOST_11865 [Armillaria ostoyae]|uniref:Uncharacterized protein n=1 Tax=Armillaria ostoyae TaxID=47428 RepID=A0A284RIB2_ARMOS|nr:uncharacterized protein ARMOST_11865 [Armillaria ostoyae]